MQRRATYSLRFPTLVTLKVQAQNQSSVVINKRAQMTSWGRSVLSLGRRVSAVGLFLGDATCQAMTDSGHVIPYTQYPCSALSWIGAAITVFGEGTSLVQARLQAQRENRYNEALMELPFYRSDRLSRRSEHAEVTAAYLQDLSSNMHAKASGAKQGLVLHDPLDGYAVVPWQHLFGATKDEPVVFATSINGTLQSAVRAGWYERNNRTGLPGFHSAALTLSDELDNVQKRSSHQGSGICSTYGDFVYYGTTHKAYITCDKIRLENGATDLYYGETFHGTETDWEEVDANFGAIYFETNGARQGWTAMSDDMINSNSLHGCLCIGNDGWTVSTGAAQYTWNGDFNGYNTCWDGNCGE